MPGRYSSLIVRVLLAALILLGPLGVPIVFGMLFPSAPDGVATALLMLYLFYAIVAVMLVPAALFSAPGSSSGPSDDGGAGWDTDPPPATPPRGPRGGIPLPDADQARGRVRDRKLAYRAEWARAKA
jgi:hypothetical protein